MLISGPVFEPSLCLNFERLFWQLLTGMAVRW